MKAKSAESTFTKPNPVEEGTSVARLYMIVGCGTQFDERYAKNKDILKLFFEFPYETREFDGEEKPCVLHTDVNNVLSDRALLSKIIKAAGRSVEEFQGPDSADLSELLGTVFSIEVHHKTKGDRTFANIGTISKAKSSDVEKCPEVYKTQTYRCIDLTDPDTSKEAMKQVYSFVLKNAFEKSDHLANPGLIQEAIEELDAERAAAREARDDSKEESAPPTKEKKAKKGKKAKK